MGIPEESCLCEPIWESDSIHIIGDGLHAATAKSETLPLSACIVGDLLAGAMFSIAIRSE